VSFPPPSDSDCCSSAGRTDCRVLVPQFREPLVRRPCGVTQPDSRRSSRVARAFVAYRVAGIDSRSVNVASNSAPRGRATVSSTEMKATGRSPGDDFQSGRTVASENPSPTPRIWIPSRPGRSGGAKAGEALSVIKNGTVRHSTGALVRYSDRVNPKTGHVSRPLDRPRPILCCRRLCSRYRARRRPTEAGRVVLPYCRLLASLDQTVPGVSPSTDSNKSGHQFIG
jgi:hypothetical protein